MKRVVIEQTDTGFSVQLPDAAYRCRDFQQVFRLASEAFEPRCSAHRLLNQAFFDGYARGYFTAWCQAFNSCMFKLNWSQHTFLIGVGPQDKSSLIAITAAHGAILQAPNFGVAYGEVAL